MKLTKLQRLILRKIKPLTKDEWKALRLNAYKPEK